jgi:hypothetical protein
MITPDDNISSDDTIITFALDNSILSQMITLAPDDNIASQMITFHPT